MKKSMLTTGGIFAFMLTLSLVTVSPALANDNGVQERPERNTINHNHTNSLTPKSLNGGIIYSDSGRPIWASSTASSTLGRREDRRFPAFDNFHNDFRGNFIGVVTGINGSSFTLQRKNFPWMNSTTSSSTNFTVNTSSTTVFMTGKATSSLSSIVIGKNVLVSGMFATSTNTISASRVMIDVTISTSTPHMGDHNQGNNQENNQGHDPKDDHGNQQGNNNGQNGAHRGFIGTVQSIVGNILNVLPFHHHTNASTTIAVDVSNAKIVSGHGSTTATTSLGAIQVNDKVRVSGTSTGSTSLFARIIRIFWK